MRANKHGFTLIEILFITPLVMLVVLTLIGFMVVMTGDALQARERTRMVYDVQSALDRLEQDVRLANNFRDALTADAPQGPNGTTGTFFDQNALILEQNATTANPTDLKRRLVFRENEPFACEKKEFNQILRLYVVYFVKDNTLWRRSILPDFATCDDPWQRNSCPGGFDLGTECRAKDEPVIHNVSNFDVNYLTSIDSTVTTDASLATATEIQLQTQRKVAGDELSYEGTILATYINEKQ